MELVEDSIYCHWHGCVHEIDSDPYDTGKLECSKEDWSKLWIGADYE